MKYNKKPKNLGVHEVVCEEMLFYQYLPIKLVDGVELLMEDRLNCFHPIIGAACCDFIADFGLDGFIKSYIYVTAKHLYQGKGYCFNRKGYHSDGFMTEDINYLWADKSPTVFNDTDFQLSMDDNMSIIEMKQQAMKENEFMYPEGSLLRLDQFSIHKVSENEVNGMRTFLKVSFSSDKYDLKGNAKNYLLNYDWPMKERKQSRNIPQSSLVK